jgi:ERCC4-related helicase
MEAIYFAKNTDYGASYNLAPSLLGIPAHVGLLVRMTDKLARACRLAQGQAGQVKDEPLTDTLLDLANYAVLAILSLESPGGDGCKCGNGGSMCLVLTDRKAHCEALVGLLAARGIKAELLTGDLSSKERTRVVEDLNAGRVKVLCATGQLIGEGFDCRELSTLFLTTPIRFSGRLIQCLGRVLRPALGKTRAKVYDYLDPGGVLENAARARARVYAGE